MSKVTVEIITRALLAIVAALRKEYDLPEYRGVTVIIGESDTLTGVDCGKITTDE